jgi:hypothetical protein
MDVRSMKYSQPNTPKGIFVPLRGLLKTYLLLYCSHRSHVSASPILKRSPTERAKQPPALLPAPPVDPLTHPSMSLPRVDS